MKLGAINKGKQKLLVLVKLDKSSTPLIWMEIEFKAGLAARTINELKVLAHQIVENFEFGTFTA